MSYTVGIAEQSQDAVLASVKTNIDKIALLGEETVNNIVYYSIIGVVAFMLAFLIIILLFLVIAKFVTCRAGILIFGVLVLFCLVIAYTIIASSTQFAKKKFNVAANIYSNFVSSERLLEIIDESAVVYLENNK